VMDAPRSVTQRVLDMAFGRTYPEQATNAFTGGLGTINFANPLSKAMWLIARKRLEPEMRGAIERSPYNFRLRTMPFENKALSPYESGAFVQTRAKPGGYLNTSIASALREGSNPFAVVGHEGGHAAQSAASRLTEPFPGLAYKAGRTFGLPEELLPLYTESKFAKPGVLPHDVIVSQPEVYRQSLQDWFRPTYDPSYVSEPKAFSISLNEILSSMGQRGAPNLNADDLLRNAEWLRKWGLIK